MNTTPRAPAVTFVTPRYGPEVAGGAESGARALAEGLAGDGHAVSVLTTCALSSQTWEDHYNPGADKINGVEVQRFSVRAPRGPDFWKLHRQVIRRAADVDRATALAWVDGHGPDSPDLIEAAAAVDQGVLALYPYCYQSTVRSALVSRRPVVLHAAAHRELQLDFCVFDELFKRVSGFAHHTRAEQSLILSRTPAAALKPQAVVGLPVERPAGLDTLSPQAVRSQLGLGDEPIVLYLGRVDRSKGCHDLAAAFEQAPPADAVLVMAGTVAEAPPKSAAARLRLVGPVSDTQKWALLEAADVLVQPSRFESFSLVVAEAWLSGTPVLVNGRTAALREQCVEAGGGLHYRDSAEFASGLRRLLDDEALRHRLGAAGRVYVERRYAWPTVRKRYLSLLSRLG